MDLLEGLVCKEPLKHWDDLLYPAVAFEAALSQNRSMAIDIKGELEVGHPLHGLEVTYWNTLDGPSRIKRINIQ